MKKVILTILSSIFVLSLYAQSVDDKYGPNKEECVKYISYYEEYFKNKDYESAMPSWRKAFKLCPATSRQRLFSDGAVLYRKQISKCKNPILRQQLIDTLFMIHDIRIEAFPSSALSTLNNKGLDAVNYIKDNDEKLFGITNEVITKNGKETKPSILQIAFNAACNLYGNGAMSADMLIETYEKYMGVMEEIQKVDTTAMTKKIGTDIESLFISSKVASCENLIELFTPRYNANPDDLALAQNIVKMLRTTDDCIDNNLYLKAVNTMYRLNPNAAAAFSLYKLYSTRGDYKSAVAKAQEAVDLEEEREIKADYYLDLANYAYASKDNSLAVKAAASAINCDDDNDIKGKAFFLLGKVWGTLKGEGDEVSQRAHFWVAVDYLAKAKAADASLAEECDKLIVQFRAFFPQAAEAFMYGVTEGQIYNVNYSGGLNASTIVRLQK
ncbi:MAG: hypothetical protein HUJ95_06710 [Bacteroidales bacterium]|nr:hypothetical protein [Bacteroidales bacterium]